ncbi:MAG TPA: hypothetical protein VK911_13500 [Vicinamibacterales bacterium]|nr:hypothetical protein [Vicinamibacterales bacterium]
MLRRLGPALVVCAGLVVPVVAGAQTADELIARNVEAKGGLERIRAVQTLRMTGRMTVAPGTEAPFVMEIERPNKMRLDFTVEGQSGSQAFDGKTGWQFLPFAGHREPQQLPTQVTRGLEEQADFAGPLVGARAKGTQVAYAGTVKLDTGEAHKLVLTLANGEERTIYLDGRSYLEVRGEATVKARGREIVMESIIADHKPVDGLVLPHRMESGPRGAPEKMRMVVEMYELNVPIDGARFAMPGKK